MTWPRSTPRPSWTPCSTSPRRVPGRARSAVDHPLHRFGVAVALHPHTGRRGVELVEVIGGEVQRDRSEVLLEALEAPGPRDRRDPRLLREQPGQGHLADA